MQCNPLTCLDKDEWLALTDFQSRLENTGCDAFCANRPLININRRLGSLNSWHSNTFLSYSNILTQHIMLSSDSWLHLLGAYFNQSDGTPGRLQVSFSSLILSTAQEEEHGRHHVKRAEPFVPLGFFLGRTRSPCVGPPPLTSARPRSPGKLSMWASPGH